MEALEGRDRLNAAVEQILQRDEEFAARVQNLDDMQVAEDRSVRFYDNESTVESRRLSTMTAPRPDGPSGSGPSASLALPSGPRTSPSESQASLASRREFE